MLQPLRIKASLPALASLTAPPFGHFWKSNLSDFSVISGERAQTFFYSKGPCQKGT